MDMPKIVVMLMRNGTKPVPFGPFDSYDEARTWAETELSVREYEWYETNYIRSIKKESCGA